MRDGFLKSLTSLIILSVVIIAVSAYFVFDKMIIGPAFLGLGFLSLIIIKLFSIKFSAIYPDFVFGAIDNGFLIFAATIGASLAGVPGAIIGGAAGNTITDSFGGLFEGICC